MMYGLGEKKYRCSQESRKVRNWEEQMWWG